MATKGWSLGALIDALKAGAFADFGTASGTIAQGNDSRIVGALQKSGDTMTGGLAVNGFAGPLGPSGWRPNIVLGGSGNGGITTQTGNGIGLNADSNIYFWNDSGGYAATLTGNSFNISRPVYATGEISSNLGNITASNGSIVAKTAAGSATFSSNGNISGSLWDGGLLSTHLANRTNTASQATRGWFKDQRTGIIFQWTSGVQQLTEAAQRVPFPITFPNNIFQSFVSTRVTGGTVDTGYNSMYQMKSFDRTGADVFLQYLPGGGSFIPDVFAIGN